MLSLSDLALYSPQVYMGVWGGLTLSSQQWVRDAGKMEERFAPQIHEVSPWPPWSLVQNIWSGPLPRSVTADEQMAATGFGGYIPAPQIEPIVPQFLPSFLSMFLQMWPLCLAPRSVLLTSNFNIPSSLLKYVGISGIPECPADYLPPALQQGRA